MRKLLLILIVVLSFWSCNLSLIEIGTDMLRVKIDNKGFITSFQDKISSKEYLPKGAVSPLLSLYKDSLYIDPVSAAYDKESRLLTLNYENGSVAMIKIESKSSYFRIELQSLEPRNGIEAVQWGPFSTTLDKWIGEAVGIVRNDDFAIGVQALNPFTVEGTPGMTNDFCMLIEPLPGQSLPDSLKNKVGTEINIDVNREGDIPDYVRIYRGIAAVKDNNGSKLLMHAKDRRTSKITGTRENIQYVAPVEQDFIGTAIALFGCPETKTLDVIEEIELAENLPHPVIDGEWIKRSSRYNTPYLLYEGQSQDNAIKYAKLFGFNLVHIGDLFESWGHFGLNTARFPDGAKGIKKYTDEAKAEGISLGVHTLTTFTSPHDLYVSPIPSDSLAKTGSSILVKEIGVTDDIIYIENPEYFLNKGITNTIKIGKELIRYTRVIEEKPFRLEGCLRGQYGTIAQLHKEGSIVDKLTNNCYAGFYPDIHLQDSYARRLAEVCNETGLGLMDFDGYGYSPIGYDTYANAKFMDIWYRQLAKPVIVCGSQPSHYFWHIFTFMNWGEPWYNALRESQVNYRIENQRFFERNLMPNMLGWFSLHPDYRIEDIEWIQARSAAFDAGYLLRMDENVEKNGFIEQISEAVREWQKARKAGAFTKELTDKMKDPKTEFHLTKVDGKRWDISPIDFKQNIIGSGIKAILTDKTFSAEAAYKNPFDKQTIQFYLSVYKQNGEADTRINNLIIELGSSQLLSIDCPVQAGERLWCDGKYIYLCDTNWKVLRQLTFSKLPQLQNGENQIQITGEFSGKNAPKINLDIKSAGKPERIGARH